MFGYVLPPLRQLPQEETERFRRLYCGLCHTLRRRCGWRARFILNYDFAFLAMLLSPGGEPEFAEGRCPASPVCRRCFQRQDAALELAADESVILTYWKLRDGVADHGFFGSLGYRLLSRSLHPAYRRARQRLPEFDGQVREQLAALSALEKSGCASIDAAADTFARLLEAAALAVPEEDRRRILRQMLYHLGRWIYLVDAADDMKKDLRRGGYNPLPVRYALTDGSWNAPARREFAATLDHSVHMIATAFELWDFGCWIVLLRATVYDGLFQVGKAVLDGTFHVRSQKKDRLLRKPYE